MIEEQTIPLSTEFRLEQKRHIKHGFPGPNSRALAHRRASAVPRGVTSTVPVYVADSDGAIIRDVDDNAFIDLGSGIAVTSIGASNRDVVNAVREQVGHFTHTAFGITPYEGYVAVAECLAALTPGDFDKRTVLFNSGAEAVENAVKVARLATGRGAVVAFDHAYHGRTNLALALTAKSMPYKSKFGPFPPEIYRVPTSYPFREENSTITGTEAAQRAVEMIQAQVDAQSVAAIIIEPIQGEGGFIVPADGFLPELASWAKANGVVFIADEVQSGFCRTGNWFAVNHEDLVPDILVMAKGIAGGMPLSAITGRANLFDAVHPGGLGGTFGGNPVACAAALSTITTMKEQNLISCARDIEGKVRNWYAGLHSHLGASGILGELRGRGAMLAIELVEPGTKVPNAHATRMIAEQCLQEGVIILVCGTYNNVIRLLPPLVITDELLADGLHVLENAIRIASET